MSEMVERVARAMDPYAWDNITFNMRREVSKNQARAAIEAMHLEQLIRDAYVRGVEWACENPNDAEYRFKAAADYADKTLSAALNEEG